MYMLLINSAQSSNTIFFSHKIGNSEFAGSKTTSTRVINKYKK